MSDPTLPVEPTPPALPSPAEADPDEVPALIRGLALQTLFQAALTQRDGDEQEAAKLNTTAEALIRMAHDGHKMNRRWAKLTGKDATVA